MQPDGQPDGLQSDELQPDELQPDGPDGLQSDGLQSDGLWPGLGFPAVNHCTHHERSSVLVSPGHGGTTGRNDNSKVADECKGIMT